MQSGSSIQWSGWLTEGGRARRPNRGWVSMRSVFISLFLTTDRQLPHHIQFAAVYLHLSETGTLLPSTRDRGVQRQVRTPDFEEDI